MSAAARDGAPARAGTVRGEDGVILYGVAPLGAAISASPGASVWSTGTSNEVTSPLDGQLHACCHQIVIGYGLADSRVSTRQCAEAQQHLQFLIRKNEGLV